MMKNQIPNEDNQFGHETEELYQKNIRLEENIQSMGELEMITDLQNEEYIVELQSEIDKKPRSLDITIPNKPQSVIQVESDRQEDKKTEERHKKFRPHVMCPLPNCKRKVLNLPRHIRSQRYHGHDLEFKDRSIYIKNIFPETKKKSKTKRMKCEYCGSHQTRLSKHQIKCKLKKEHDCVRSLFQCEDDKKHDVADADKALQKFETYLKGPDCMLSLEQAKHSTNMLKRFMNLGKMRNMEELLNESKVKEVYMKLLKGGLKVQFCNDYLRMIKKYLDAAVILSDMDHKSVMTVKNILDNWIRNSEGSYS